MKKILAIIAAAGIVSMAGVAMAATANLGVSATVLQTCTMTGGAIAFGNLDPTAPVAKSINSTGVTITCTNGTDYTLGGNNGANAAGTQKRLANGTNYIPYSVTIPAGGTGSGSAEAVTITGDIALNSYATAPAGAYSDTIELTVLPVTP